MSRRRNYPRSRTIPRMPKPSYRRTSSPLWRTGKISPWRLRQVWAYISVPGQEQHAIRTIAERLHYNPTTVSHCLWDLACFGYIILRPRHQRARTIVVPLRFI